MAINKNFVVKNGLEVADDLLIADGTTQNVGIGTTTAKFKLEVKGDVSFDKRIYLSPLETTVKSTTGIVSVTSPSSITGINTSGIRVGDSIDDGPGGLLRTNTKIISIGSSVLNILPPHTRISSTPAVINVTVVRTETSGEEGQVIISTGENSPATWAELPKTEIQEETLDQDFYPTFAGGIGRTDIKITSDKLSFNPSSGSLGISTSSPEYTLDVRGDIRATGIVTSNTSYAVVANSTFLNSDDAVIGQLESETITANTLISQDIVNTTITSNEGNFNTVNSLSIDSDSASIDQLQSENITADQITATTVDAEDGIFDNLSSSNIFSGSGTIQQLESEGIQATSANINNLTADVSYLGVSTAISFEADEITATERITSPQYYGNGDTLVGIVTNLVPGIGIDLFPNQTPGNKGEVIIQSYKPIGKTIFVSQTGIDSNTGLAENQPKRTIKAAAAIAFPGDTIKVFPGFYVEENPIYLSKNVAVEGTELRNCVVTPKFYDRDLFYVNNSCHITDLSFIGTQDMVDGASVVSLQPLLGVSADRFFDAARMIRYNLDYIASESVGFLTSGFSNFAGSHREQDAARLIDLNIDYIAAESVGFLTSPSGLNFSVPAPGTTSDCADDIRDIFRSVSNDLKAKSNKKSVGAALSYFNNSGALVHITGVGVSQATISTLNYAVGVAKSVINNLTPPISYQSSVAQVIDPSVIVVPGGCVGVGTTIAQLVGIITSAIGAGNTLSLPAIQFGVNLDSKDCADDVKDIWKCVIHDITRGGNSRCVAAGKSYYDEDWNLIPQILKNPGEVAQTIATVDYSFNVARAVVNNVTWGGYPVGLGTTVTNAVYDSYTGLTTITASNHGLLKDDAVKIVGLGFTCPSGPGIVTYPSGNLGYVFNVQKVINSNSFEVVVGQSTLPHTYVSGGTVQKYRNFNSEYTQLKDLGMQPDPLTGYNNAINGCANVVSALKSCVGVVTTIVGLGSTAGITTTYPGNSGVGITSILGITTVTYDNESGEALITVPGFNVKEGDIVEVRNVSFACSSNGGSISTQHFPSGKYGYLFDVTDVSDDSFKINVGTSTLPHTYAGNGFVVNRAFSISTAVYNNVTGITTITANGLKVRSGQTITIRDLNFTCPSGSGTTTIYPTGSEGYEFKILDVVIDKPFSITNAIYNNTTGIVTITAPGSNIQSNDIVELAGLEFSCPDSPPNLIYPSGKFGYDFRVISSIGSTFTVNVGVSTLPHTYVSGGTVINRTQLENNQFTIRVGVSTIPHTYVSGGVAIPEYSPGVGPITQGPYVRNCTNFISKSIGMKIDGFAAEPGDKDDIGVTGTMSVDSYTQYNQGGIGVSITNGAYAQLVSIFTICDDIAIFTGSGGQCDITNSNSSFGRLGLVSNGVGDAKTKSIYRYTGIAATTAPAEQSTIIVSGIGNYRPYDGQALYFGELFYTVQRVEITDGGSGYTSPPFVTLDNPPSGVNGIRAEAIATVQNGSVTSIDLISTGTQYRTPPNITISGGGGSGAKATAIMAPIYYTIESATLPSAGISTITLNNNLNSIVSTGTTIYFTRLSLQITSSHSFEWVGSGNDINKAKPALGGVVIPENEVVKIDGGEVVYTSTDQAGNFRIGDGLVVNQLTGTVSGRAFSQSLINTVTPLIIALGN